ncbi:hypothetical protein LTR66_000168 [Elasticomyces elasticus]|nr:hypothetical protein LTR50_001627 [Elasticomyces elasticus]KAK5001082.1 hypothetical protein LTR66_000168 [Elasticomyces elasticus]
MNTIRSVGYGWGVLILAGGGAYYFAKRSINADRAERAEAEHRKRAISQRLRTQELANPYPKESTSGTKETRSMANTPSPTTNVPAKSQPVSSQPTLGPAGASSTSIAGGSGSGRGDETLDHASSPSTEASEDPSPVSHVAATESGYVQQRSKYESKEPFRSKKGDRFS